MPEAGPGLLWRAARPLLFRLEPERAHRLAMALFAAATALPGTRSALRRRAAPPDPGLAARLWGLELGGPVGLAAGFDKAGRWVGVLPALGFDFLEVGTVTARAQEGNPTPRLFRLPADRALVNRLGFNNPGAAAVAGTLARRPAPVPVGVNLGKSRDVPVEGALDDYLTSLEAVWPHAAYLAVNVSSPNTPGLRELQRPEALRRLLGGLAARNRELATAAGTTPRPLVGKLAPDLAPEALDAAVDLCLELGVDGLIATNTTVRRDGLRTPPETLERIGDGGLSGAPLRQPARQMVARIHARAGARLPVVGVGGVMGPDDAWELLRAGATAIQIYTGLVYEGPGLVRRIHRGLSRRLAERGASLAEVVGEASRATGTMGLANENRGPRAATPGPRREGER